jgi:hypothetical protein
VPPVRQTPVSADPAGGRRPPKDDDLSDPATERGGGIQKRSDQAQSMGDQPAGPAAMLMDLTPEQRDRLQRLLEEELRAAYRSALERGARPADLKELLADRREALDGLLLELADDGEHPVDDAGDGRGVGEQGG